MIRMGMRIVNPDGTLTHEGALALGKIAQDASTFSAARDAIAEVAPAAGGAVIDAEARAELAAIRAALG